MNRSKLLGDFFGGLGSMLVALPSAVAFGIAVFAPLGADAAGQGALFGLIGVVALGLVAPLIGGAERLITAPCAPSAAVLAGLVAGMTAKGGVDANQVLLLCSMVGLMCGALQLLFGFLGGGKLIKFIPFPVVSGYLSGVGFIIIGSQLPKLLGVPKGPHVVAACLDPSQWQKTGLMVGLVTMAAMIGAPKVTKAVPAAIIAIICGIGAYFLLSINQPRLLEMDHNKLIIGQVPTPSGAEFLESLKNRFTAVGEITGEALGDLLFPALTLSVLLAIDALKTCVIVDALTRSRHNSNRVLLSQGAANLAAAALGGMSGAGTMGATLVNVNSGGQTRLSGMLEGALSLIAVVLLSSLVAWVPVASLAGILIVVGFRMIDKHSFALLKQRSTVLDFAVIAVVVITAVALNLIAAAGVGLALAIFLFVRDQIRGSVVRRKTFGDQIFSKRRRLPSEMQVLEQRGQETVIFELQGNLFFGTTDQLFKEVEPHMAKAKYIIMDMRRIQTVDFTAAHMLEQLEAQVKEKGGKLIFTNLPRSLASGKNLQTYLDDLGLSHDKRAILILANLETALEWTEERVLEDAGIARGTEHPLALREIEAFTALPSAVIDLLQMCTRDRVVAAGERVFSRGDSGDEIFVIRQGDVRIEFPLAGEKKHHIATFGRGDIFGDMSFLDRGQRSADAVAVGETKLFVISRGDFDQAANREPGLGRHFFLSLARLLALRLRHTDHELTALLDA